MLTVNFTNTILFCETARKHLLQRGGGTLCVLSSVAGDSWKKTGRAVWSGQSRIIALSESLDHKYYSYGLRTICVKPGFIRTPMTANLKSPPFFRDCHNAASQIIRAIERGKPVIYTPSIWKWIMYVIRCLPRFVMRKIIFNCIVRMTMLSNPSGNIQNSREFSSQESKLTSAERKTKNAILSQPVVPFRSIRYASGGFGGRNGRDVDPGA
jgi:hypothetical protein